MVSARQVIWSCVNGVQLHWLFSDVNYVVPGSSWNKDGKVIFYFLINLKLSFALANLNAALAGF